MTAPPEGIALAAVPTREDPRDVVVARDGLTLGELPQGAKVGTGSPRRVAQIAALGFGVDLVGVRGNVDTRIGKVASGDLDAVVLARAGLDVAYIEKQPGHRPVSTFTAAATLPAHPTALGRALLAFSGADVVEATLARGLRPYTPHTVTSPDRFRRALGVTRLTRVAVTRCLPA